MMRAALLLSLAAHAASACVSNAAPLISECMAVPDGMASVLRARNHVTATPIQAAALARAEAGDSLILHAQTGSGKSLAMLLPALTRAERSGGKVLTLSPTRELGVQLVDEAQSLLSNDEKVALLAQVCARLPWLSLDARLGSFYCIRACFSGPRGERGGRDGGSYGRSDADGVLPAVEL